MSGVRQCKPASGLGQAFVVGAARASFYCADMPKVSLRHKLALLAGIPVLGAILLSGLIVRDAQNDARKAAALGSVENLARLSLLMTEALDALHAERALTSLVQGASRRRVAEQKAKDEATAVDDKNSKKAKRPEPDEPSEGVDAVAELLQAEEAANGDPEEAPAKSVEHVNIAHIQSLLVAQQRHTDVAVRGLERFLEGRRLSDLPQRLAGNLEQALGPLRELDEFRARGKLGHRALDLDVIVNYYLQATHSLIGAIAALTELSDDGELLRLITSLVSSLEIAERASAQHAVVSYALANGQFPPGSFRTLVRMVSEEKTHIDALRTTSAAEEAALFAEIANGPATQAADAMRVSVMETLEEELSLDTESWFQLQAAKVEELAGLSKLLNERVRGVALSKRQLTERQLWLSSSLAAVIVFSSLLMAWAIARGVTRNVGALEAASRRVGQGDLDTKVDITSGDELGALGHTFNEMMTQLGQAQIALQEQVRMASELEIAADLQRALLPPQPKHPDFEFAGVMLPADEVGGDFYDVLTDAEGRHLWLTVGDVSDHGLSAGLVMLMTQSAFASQFHGSPDAEPSDVYRHVNRTLRQNVTRRLEDNKYVTAQLLSYQGNGVFSCAGGHEWPVVYRAGARKTELIEAAGPWLGIVDELNEVPTSTLALQPGDILCLYSDGIIEARDEQGELFDVARLEAVLGEASASCDDLSEIAARVVEKAREHCEKREDDWTMLLVRRKRAA